MNPFFKSEAEGWKFKKSLKSLEHFFTAVIGQNNLRNRFLFQFVAEGSNEISYMEQLKI